MDASGLNQLCEHCGKRLSRCKGKLHNLHPGKICTPCYKIREGYHAPSVPVASPPIKRSHKRQERRSPRSASPPSAAAPSTRSKRPYDTLKPTQKWKRRKQLRAEVDAAVKRVGCPLEAIQQPPTPSAADVIHLPSPAGCSSCIIACFALTTGSRTTSRSGALQSTTSSSIGSLKHIPSPFRSCTCCATHWSSLSAIASSVAHQRRRLSPSTRSSTRSFTTIISTKAATLLNDCAALSLMLPFVRCNHSSANNSTHLFLFLTLLTL
jgi:hypothetical protein